MGALSMTRKIDLHPYATTRNGVLYVRQPVLEIVWVHVGSLAALARATMSRCCNSWTSSMRIAVNKLQSLRLPP